MVAAPLTPRLWRALGLAYRAGQPEPATRYMLEALAAIGRGGADDPGGAGNEAAP